MSQARQTHSLPKPIPLRKSFKSGALSVSIDTLKSARVTCSVSHEDWRTRQKSFQLSTPDTKANSRISRGLSRMSRPAVAIPEKLFFKIGEVCELAGVQA